MATRDDFHAHVRSLLAKRCGYHCSNPDCRRETSGPGQDADTAVNIGVGAHITAASAGGPRYDDTLTKEQRFAASNGIWLCQTCSSLIDRDVAKYPTPLLNEWKTGAEARAMSLIESPARPEGPDEPVLELRATDPSKAWLAYSSRSTMFVGRDKEQELLSNFLESSRKFTWLLLTGTGGSGKSRLALELCYQSRPGWNAGFLSRPTAPLRWTHFRPSRRTLIVIDYVASRAAEVSDIVLALHGSASYLLYPIRLLILERGLGYWWSKFRREESDNESAEIEACAFAEPIRLDALDESSMLKLAAEIAASRKGEWSARKAFDFVHRMISIDPRGRPLFVMMVAEYLDSTKDDSVASAELLQHVLGKENARRKSLISDPDRCKQMENLLLLSTFVGGLLPDANGFEFLASSDVAGLLPDANLVDDSLYSDFSGSAPGGNSFQGLQPDILGERYLLDQLSAPGRAGMQAQRLLRAAWRFQPNDLAVIASRTFTDFPTDPALAALFDLPLDTPEDRLSWSEMVCDLVLNSHRSDHPFAQSQFAKLREAANSHENERELQMSLARADFNLGHILLFEEENYPAAAAQFQAAIKRAGEGSLVAALAEHGLGIILHNRDEDSELALQAVSTVIDLPETGDEQRASALNNRADIYAKRGDHDNAILDRTRVLSLAETSYDRRFIALFRRSESYLAKGDPDAALADLEQILKTSDITPHQKGNARLKRAKVYLRLHKTDEAASDLKAISTAPLLFPGTRAIAMVELAFLLRSQAEQVKAIPLLEFAAKDPEAFPETRIDAIICQALLAEDVGDPNAAGGLWREVVGNPDATANQIKLAWEHLEAGTSGKEPD
jgi:tetratricopeptide (TPR) repeat protein